MKKRFGPRRGGALACLLALALCLLAGCGGKKEAAAITRLEQLAEPGRKIGVASDTAEDRLVAREFPEAKIEYFRDEMAAYTSVRQGKLDAYVFNQTSMRSAIYFGMEGVRLLDETLGEGNISGVALSPVTKIPDLEGKVNAFLEEIKADGTMDDAAQRWLVMHDEAMPAIDVPETSALRLVVGTTGSNAPFTYYVGTELAGYDIELARRFAAWMGAALEFKIYDYDGIVAAAQSGDVDCIFANLFITPERTEALRFSEPTYVSAVGVMVRDTGAAATEASEVRWQDYNGKRLGVLVGPLMEDAAAQFFPDSEYLLFNSYPDCAAALLAGRIDGFLGDEPGMISMHAENPEIDYIHESLTENNYAFAFRKDDARSAALCDELDEFLAQSWADGTMEDIAAIWLGVDEDRKDVDMSDLTGQNGTIRVVTTSTDMPWSYIKDGKNVGYDIDLVVRFCRARGYALELGDVDFAGRIPAVQSGKYDFSTDMNVTPEREEQVRFCSPTAHGGIVLAVKASDLAATQTANAPSLAFERVDELEGKRIGVMTGSIQDAQVAERLPSAERLYFSSMPDMLAALRANKIDGFVLDEPAARSAAAADSELAIFPESLGSSDYAFILTKSERGSVLCEALSDYLDALRDDGTLARLQSKWFDCADPAALESTDYRGLPPEKGTIRVATEQYPPFSLCVDGFYSGYEIELLSMFCRDRGYALEIEEMNVDAVLPAVQSGICDIGCDCFSITEERKESMLFSSPDYVGGTALVVLKDAPAQEHNSSFFASVRESFEKTFLRENRWKLFVSGIGTTLLITVLSILLGTALGFGIYLLCRNGNPVANGIARFFVWLVHGMPMVVLMMILYYIIFGKVAISGTVVAIIGFTLVFGASVFGMLKSGVGAVEKGQMEAAYALGYTDNRAFFRVILPQALPHFFPAYKGEITATIKATAIVGYVAVQDLTKMGDIVRSRTYEAFFPLIAVAIIYFILAGVLTAIVNRLGVYIDPRRRKKEDVLKGVTAE